MATETPEIQFKHPFSLSTNVQKPIQSRFLLSIRTKNDFNDPNKLGAENTVEAILLKERQKNPYSLNKD